MKWLISQFFFEKTFLTAFCIFIQILEIKYVFLCYDNFIIK
ncbi:hypothetical protein BTBSAS_20282 [Brochothrix thermosphacta]|uniref:Uncharacterized protein n=1 Tax=Brochothrix thermosphacta TaxID=2756 RepID=A0A2X0S6R4_BROTH|nr:hypothetical protein BTBSAS_20282 [Brochothrix thermosphacta]